MLIQNHVSLSMGLVYADIEVINGADLILASKGYIKEDEVRKMSVEMLVDSGAYMMAINETIKTQLGLDVKEQRTAQLANGELLELDVVGPIEIRFKNRRSMVDAMVLPDDAQPLLGAIALEDMDVVILPYSRELEVNPAHPNMVQMSMK